MTALGLKAGAILLVLLLTFAGGFYVGRVGLEKDDARATVRRDAQNVRQEALDATRINQEAKRLADSELDPIAAPVVRLQYLAPTACVLRAPTPGPLPHGTPVLPAASPVGPVPGPDVGRPLVQIGHACDAQVAGLEDYIEHVCRVPAP
jgi:hypothetical protein